MGRTSCTVSLAPLDGPPAAIAPGPAGFRSLPFFAPAFGGVLTLAGTDASSSASKRAFSAFRASSAFRFSSFSSLLPLPPFEPSAHLSDSFFSWKSI